MAKLQEQKKLVSTLNDFFKNTGYSNEQTSQYRLKNINEGYIPEEDFLGYLKYNNLTFTDKFELWRKKTNFSKKNKFVLDRIYKIQVLYRSCLDDNFIEPVFEEIAGLTESNTLIKLKKGIRISQLGTDLIHPLGFLEILLKKYTDTQKFFLGVISVPIIGAIIFAAIKIAYLFITKQ